MSEQFVTTIVDHQGDLVSRQRPLLKIGAMSVAASNSRSRLAAAGKAGKIANKRAKKKPGKRCRRQIADCHEFVIISCSDQADTAACRERALPCCDPLSTCDATAMLECFLIP